MKLYREKLESLDVRARSFRALAPITLALLLPHFAHSAPPRANRLREHRAARRIHCLEQQLPEFLRRLYPLVKPPRFDEPGAQERSVHWSGSPELKDAPVGTAERAAQLVDRVFDDQTGLARRAMEGISHRESLDPETLPQSGILWDYYFRAYDRIVGYSKGYSDVMVRMSAKLPRQGTLLELGAGTLNFSSFRLHTAPEVRIVAIDLAPKALAVGQKKLAAVAPSHEPSRHLLIRGSVAELPMRDDALFDGAFMNNVLYTLPDSPGHAVKLAVLKNVFTRLKPGAVFTIADPVPRPHASAEEIKGFLKQVAMSAASNGSPMTEYDLVMAALVNKLYLTGNSKLRLLAASELEALARQAGFIVEESEPAYYGGVTRLTLRKPR